MDLAELEQVYQKINNFYLQKNYKLATAIYTYKGHQAITPSDASTGFFMKSINRIESYIAGVHTYQNEAVKVMIDSSENIIGISYPDTGAAIVGVNISQKSEQLKKIIEKITIKQVGVTKQEITIIYKKELPYEKAKMIVNDKGFLEEIVLYQASDIAFEDPLGNTLYDKAKIKMEFKDISATDKKFSLKISDLIIKQEKTYKTTPAFSSFELIDFRYNP